MPSVNAPPVMLINVEVFHAIAARHPDWKFKLYPREIVQEDARRDYGYDFFQTAIDPTTRNYLSEDFFFVEEARRLGFETYLLPQAITKNVESFEYTMNLGFLAASGIGVRNIKIDTAETPMQ